MQLEGKACPQGWASGRKQAASDDASARLHQRPTTLLLHGATVFWETGKTQKGTTGTCRVMSRGRAGEGVLAGGHFVHLLPLWCGGEHRPQGW